MISYYFYSRSTVPHFPSNQLHGYTRGRGGGCRRSLKNSNLMVHFLKLLCVSEVIMISGVWIASSGGRQGASQDAWVNVLLK